MVKIVNRERGIVLSDGTQHFVTEYRGKSTETKPEAQEGDTFYENDTQTWFMHDGDDWVEQFTLED